MRTDCIAVAEARGQLVADQTVDVSWDGILLRARGWATVGESVRLSLRIPETDVWLQSWGSVRRVAKGLRQGDGGPAVGVQLDRMNGLARLLWMSVVRTFPPAGGQRGPRRDYTHTVARIAEEH